MSAMTKIKEIIDNIPKMPPDLYKQVITATVDAIMLQPSVADNYYQYICKYYIEDEIDMELDTNKLKLDMEQYEFYKKYLTDIRTEFVERRKNNA